MAPFSVPSIGSFNYSNGAYKQCSQSNIPSCQYTECIVYLCGSCEWVGIRLTFFDLSWGGKKKVNKNIKDAMNFKTVSSRLVAYSTFAGRIVQLFIQVFQWPSLLLYCLRHSFNNNTKMSESGKDHNSKRQNTLWVKVSSQKCDLSGHWLCCPSRSSVVLQLAAGTPEQNMRVWLILEIWRGISLLFLFLFLK